MVEKTTPLPLRSDEPTAPMPLSRDVSDFAELVHKSASVDRDREPEVRERRTRFRAPAEKNTSRPLDLTLLGARIRSISKRHDHRIHDLAMDIYDDMDLEEQIDISRAGIIFIVLSTATNYRDPNYRPFKDLRGINFSDVRKLRATVDNSDLDLTEVDVLLEPPEGYEESLKGKNKTETETKPSDKDGKSLGEVSGYGSDYNLFGAVMVAVMMGCTVFLSAAVVNAAFTDDRKVAKSVFELLTMVVKLLGSFFG